MPSWETYLVPPRLGRSRNQIVPQSEHHQLGNRVDLQFAQNIIPMRLGGLSADVEKDRDFACALPFCNVLHDLLFAGGEFADVYLLGSGTSCMSKTVEYQVIYARSEECHPAGYSVDGRNQVSRCVALENESSRSSLKRFFHHLFGIGD